MSLRWFAVGLFVCTSSIPGIGQPLPVWRFAHPDSKSLIGVDVRRIRQSGFAHFLEVDFLKSLVGNMAGLELVSHIDTVLISSPGLPEGDLPTQQPPLLIVVQGPFDTDQVRRILRDHGAKPQAFDSVTVYRPQAAAAREFAFALLDSRTLLAGDAQSVFSAIERRSQPAADPVNPAIARAQSLSATNDFWAVSSQPANWLGHLLPLNSMGATALEVGFSFHGGLTLNGSLTTGSELDARTLRDDFKQLIKVASKDQPLARKLKFEVAGGVLGFSARITHDEAEANLQTLIGKLRPPMAAEVQPVATPKPQVIRIYGLDEGGRDIKYKP